ncbi:hypothetical protein D3C78_1042490 [compost metagenome]
MNDHIGRQELQRIDNELHIFILLQELQQPCLVLAYHRGFAHQMQQMNLNALHIHPRYSPSGLQHHVMRFLRKTVDNMGAYAYAALTQSADCIQIAFGVMCAIDKRGCGFMHGLQTHLYPKVGAFVQLSQIVHDVIRQAIRTRSDRQADNPRLLQNNLVVFAKLLHRRVRVCIGLKIADILRIRPFFVLAVANMIKLGDEIVAAASSKVARSARTAERAAALRDGAVPVRACKACVEHNLKYLAAKLLSHFVIPCMKSFIAPEHNRLR